MAKKYTDQDISFYGPETADVPVDISVNELDEKEKEGYPQTAERKKRTEKEGVLANTGENERN